MSQEKQPSKPDIVSSIFSRGDKKRISSLFTPKRTGTPPPAESGETHDKVKVVIKKKLPIGLDIGTNSVKIVQLGLDSHGSLKIINMIVEELPIEAITNEKERLHILPEFLKKMLQRNGLKGDCFVMNQSINAKINLIKLPKMPSNEIDNAMGWEIKQTNQTDSNEIVSDYIVLENQGTGFLGNQIGALTITAHKKDIFEHMALLESAGLNPLAIDIESLAGVATLNYSKKLGADELALFLDFGAGKTYLNIINNKELLYARILNISGNSLTKAVSEYCNVNWDEAEEMKKNFGIASSGDDSSGKASQTRNAIFPLLESMVQDIEHTFKYFSYQVTQSQIIRFNRIILSGGSSCLKGLLPFLGNRLDVDVNAVCLPETLESQEYSSLDECFSRRINVALGLALRGVASE